MNLIYTSTRLNYLIDMRASMEIAGDEVDRSSCQEHALFEDILTYKYSYEKML